MRATLTLFTTIFFITFSGCSAKTKGFIEDLYSNTKTRSASKQDYSNSPRESQKIINQEKSIREVQDINNNYTIDETYKATGKIIDASYDKDIKLYMYVFLEDGNSDPISFYYDKDLKPIGKTVTISVKENFLTSISSERKTKRTLNKRIKSDIKTPIVEKINTL
jgi:hypothetical protein